MAGIGSLQVGTDLLAHDGSKITVALLEKIVKPNEEDEFVYYLIIEPSPEGKFEYFAGCENNLFALATEMSPICNISKADKLALGVIMRVVSESVGQFNAIYSFS